MGRPKKYDRRQELRNRGDQEEIMPHKGPKKKTRKWCKGRVGVRHIYSRQRLYGWTTELEVDVCDNCGKHGKYYWEDK